MASTADELIVTLTADSSGLAAGLQGATEEVKAAQAEMASSGQASADAMAASAQIPADAFAAMAAQIDASTAAAKAAIADMAASAVAPLDLLIAATSATGATIGELAAQDAAVVAAFNAGTISAEQYAEAMDALDAQTGAAVTTMEAAVAASADLTAIQTASVAPWIEETAAVDANTGALAANTAASGENAAAGGGGGGFRFHGLFGTLSVVLNALLSPIGMVTAAIGVLGFDAAQQSGRISGLNDALIVTGDSAGVTSGQLNEWAVSIGSSIGTVGDAQAAYQELAQSGQFVGENLKQAGQAAEIFAELTDVSSQQAAKAVEKMGTDPVSAMKYLTGAQQDEVQSLIDVGNKAEAGRVAVADFTQAMQKAAAEAHGDIGIFTRLGDAIANAWDKAGQAVAVSFGGGTVEQKIAELKSELALASEGAGAKAVTLAETGTFIPGRQIPAIKAQLAAMEEVKKAQEEAAKQNAVSHDFVHTTAGWGKAGLAADEETVKRTEAVQNMGYAQRLAYEKAYWTHIHAIATKGSDEYIAAYEKISGHSAHAAHPYVAGADSGWDVGTLSSVDRSMMGTEAHQIAARQHQAEITRQVNATNLNSGAAHQTAALDMQRSHIQAMASMGTMGGSSAIAQEQAIADKIYAIKYNELEKEKALAATKPEEAARINAELIRAQDSLANTTQTLQDKSAAQQIKTAESVVSPIISTFSQVTAGFVEGTLTRQQAELRLGDALVAESINKGMQMLMHHIAIEEAKTLATAAGTAERVALTIVAEAEAAAIHTLHAIEWIVTEAAKAAASAFTAMAGIPIIGPVLAVAASIAAGAEVLSLVGKVASAEGGWDRVPHDGAMAQLHKDEMVLPADLAEGVRNMSGGGGNTYHYHIHANDAAGFEGMLKRNPGALVRALGHAGRTGHALA